MVSKKMTIKNELGIHMRPAGVLTGAIKGFDSNITIKTATKAVDAKSIMNVMAACIKGGMEIEVTCDGPDEQQALETIEKLVEDGFGEL